MKSIGLTAWLLCTLTILWAQSPYIYKVYEYCPAPGQFVNENPLYEPGNTANDMRLKAEELLADDARSLVSLGGFGGYIVFGFDHMVENRPSPYDFQVLGNAFYAEGGGQGTGGREGGSAEPGIVMVSYDANGNGKPDDAWYELAGSDYGSATTVHHYTISYERPDENKARTPHPTDTNLNDIRYLHWTDNQGQEDYMARNIAHDQPYYPQWTDAEQLTFTGTKLADNGIDESGNGTYYVLYCYAWGYADNHPNKDERSKFNIGWAVDEDGRPVNLPGAHFFKVYTALNQQCGWLGETSTEVMGAYDLHIYGGDSEDPHAHEAAVRWAESDGNHEAVYTLDGMKVDAPTKAGLYIVKQGGKRLKMIKGRR